ncbi:MAG: hypothetical protein DCF15_07230 [Phormidesmis priestleyi]|uniref:Hypervirulence associated protein TUDOR domain-containing protein n=1 Tax=Phormidesmis priestleyi TaxID=268141 RepID=A0A2W4ZGJ1_9CYAN|nr:MAG: hypothetical protein DCF15_07230 [Phormidesmis priestleyi]
MASKQTFHKGDKVQWSSGQGTAVGTIEKFITQDQSVGNSTASASQDNPRYLVKNDNTGTVTAHRPDTLSAADESTDDAQSNENSHQKSSDMLKLGDRVEWNTRQGKTTGTVKEKLTEETDIKGYTAKASKDDPQYLVESERTGSEAAHKPDALKSVD